MKKWEYKYLDYCGNDVQENTDILNKAGEEGWELTTIIRWYGRDEFLLKREISEGND